MCYRAKLTDEGSIARVAEKDIPVVKYLDKEGDKFYAPYYEKYSYNNKNHISELDVTIVTINKRVGEIAINQGLHSLTKAFFAFGNCLATAIIPKGSVYYTNGQDYVSSHLTMIEAYRDNSVSSKFIDYYHIKGNKFLINRIVNYFLRIHKWK